MKKIISLIILILFFNSVTFADGDYTKQINSVVSKIENIMKQKDFNKIFLYISLFEKSKENATQEGKNIINQIIQKLKEKYHRNNINLILRIDKNFSNGDIDDIINNNSDKIKNSDNIFIFKNNATGRFSAEQMKYTATKLKSLNPKIRILIDQEGGLVNRFNDFDENNTFDDYINSNLSLKYKYAVLSDSTKDLIKEAFLDRTTFISMDRIGEIYYSISKNNLSEKNRFLDFITYFKLYTLHKNGVNTHGIVCDLDKSNPVISGLDRSFSDQQDDYIKLGQYFVKNARILGMSLYLKHFPGHGRGDIDTHKGVLEYTDSKLDKEYLNNNIYVFDKIIKEAHLAGVEIGLMSAHVILPNSIKNKYLTTLNTADYIMTDDLGMGAYLELKDTTFENKFFSTNLFINNTNTIRVYTEENQIK